MFSWCSRTVTPVVCVACRTGETSHSLLRTVLSQFLFLVVVFRCLCGRFASRVSDQVHGIVYPMRVVDVFFYLSQGTESRTSGIKTRRNYTKRNQCKVTSIYIYLTSLHARKPVVIHDVTEAKTWCLWEQQHTS